MRLERIKNINTEMKALEPDSIGYKIMQKKTQILGFKIKNLKAQAMQILKQDAISLNAELVTPRDAILCQKKSYDCMLFGNPKSLKLLTTKMQMQPFGLKTLSKDLKKFLQPYKDFKPRIMSIINVDSNSFYTHYNTKDAIDRIYQDIERGADIIDIGGVSTKPSSERIDSITELKRLRTIFDEVKKNATKVSFSIDTYNKEVAKAAIDCGFNMINDVSGKPENMIEVLQQNPKITYILTHIQGEPSTMQQHCVYDNLILDIDSFFEEKLKFLAHHHCTKVILDVGIGFAKTTEQNIALISQLAHFKRFHKPLLIGASHKSFLRNILQDSHIEQMGATLIAHFIAMQNGASIIRVHDVEEHQKMLKLYQAFCINDIDIL